MSAFRVYRPQECGPDGYPQVWHHNVAGALDGLILAELEAGRALDFNAGIKHVVRAQAENRCLRCQHPFVVGESGHMVGDPGHDPADLGMTQEQLDKSIETSSALMHLDNGMLDKSPRTNYSACDVRCTHGGPIRARGIGEWEEHDVLSEGAVKLLRDAGCEVEAAWRILTVHHLNEAKPDLRWWNLVALCQRCHLLIQRKVTMEKPWPWEHTEWFKPYAAAWYALRYLEVELDRDEAKEIQDELLELGSREESVERMPL